MSAVSTDPEGSEVVEPTTDERIATAVAEAYGRRGYLSADGGFDAEGLCDVLMGPISEAVAVKKSDRAKVGLSRRRLMEVAFPDVAGPEDWADQPDPEVAEGVYKVLDSTVWRQTSERPDGTLQARLNGEVGMVLVRTKVNPHRTDAVYVTRDLACLLEDVLKPQRDNQKKRADRDAALTVMLIERIPQHGKRFNRELISGLTTGVDSAKAITAGPLEALVDVTDDEPVDDGSAGGDE